MDTVFKIMGISVVAVIFCVLLRTDHPSMSVLLSLAACTGILLLGIKFFSPILNAVHTIQSLTGLNHSLLDPLIKIVGIGVVTTVASGICSDAGESALSQTVEMTGMIVSMYLSLPLLLAAIELIEKMLEAVS